MKHGAVDFLVKPFPFQALDAAVERAIETARTRRQIATLTSERRNGTALDAIVGGSAAMEQVRTMIGRLAASDTTTVLIEGESGSGKEVVARAIHFRSARAERAFLQVNCAALPEHLLESELFGHERGAFTDAHAQKRGLFESAEGGSVMLDEIGDLPPGGQAKLLRLLENKTFRRVGGVQELRADVRVIAATNVNLEERVAEGRFRADLFFRLNVVRIAVPAAPRARRGRPRARRALHRPVQPGDEAAGSTASRAPAMEMLRAYHWPGNVRELRNVIERAFILHAGRGRDPARAPHAGARQRGPGEAARAARRATRRRGSSSTTSRRSSSARRWSGRAATSRRPRGSSASRATRSGTASRSTGWRSGRGCPPSPREAGGGLGIGAHESCSKLARLAETPAARHHARRVPRPRACRPARRRDGRGPAHARRGGGGRWRRSRSSPYAASSTPPRRTRSLGAGSSSRWTGTRA